MANRVTLSFDLKEITGDASLIHTVGRISTNLEAGAFVTDSSNKRLSIGEGPVKINPDGTGTVSLLESTSPDYNFTGTIFYTFHAEVINRHTRATVERSFGPFAIEADANLGDPIITDQFDTPAVAVSWRSDFRDEMDGLKAEAEATVTAATAGAVAAVSADRSAVATDRAGAEAARQEAEDLVVTGSSIALGSAEAAIVAQANVPSSPIGGALSNAMGEQAALKGVIAHAARVNQVKRWKGGKIGVAGKGVISFRMDHGFDRFRDIHFPLMRARGLSGGFGFVTGSIGNPSATYEPGVYGWGAAQRVVYRGMEPWAHSADHADCAPYGPRTVIEQIEGARAKLEEFELVPAGWQQPGVTGALTPGWAGGPASAEELSRTEVGQRLMATYGLIEAYQSGTVRVLPTDGCYLLSHATLDTLSLTAAKAWVDRATPGQGVELMFHPQWLGTTGFMSIADFTALLDYVVAKRDAGQIEVLTPSGLAFADPSTNYRMSLVANTTFAGLSKVASKIGAWTVAGTANPAGVTVETVGSDTVVRLAATTDALEQVYEHVISGALHGGAFEFAVEARNTTASVGRLQTHAFISQPGGYPDFGNDNLVAQTVPASSDWKVYRMPFVVPRLNVAPTGALTFRIRSAYHAVDFPGTLEIRSIKVQPI